MALSRFALALASLQANKKWGSLLKERILNNLPILIYPGAQASRLQKKLGGTPAFLSQVISVSFLKAGSSKVRFVTI